MDAVSHFAPLLAAAELAALRAAAVRFGPMRTYVEAPLTEGIGKGLTRRHDALLNHYRRQAAAGRTERLDVLAARANLFRGTFGEPGRAIFEGAEVLWRHAAFMESAARVTGKPLVRPSMLYANALLPGQELAVHSDTPAYRGRDQTNTPEWLLVVMLRSGLFEDLRVRVGAAVAFLSSPAGGEFLVWDGGPDAPPTAVPARANTAVGLDTDALFHGVARVGHPEAPAPPARIGSDLGWDEAAERWVLRYGGEEVRRYGWDEVRLSFQWKAKCYADEDEEALAEEPVAGGLGIEAITARLTDDMRAAGVLTETLSSPPQLAIAMIDHYVRFPTM